MAKLTIVYWRDIPAQVIVKAGRNAAKRQLADRFQEAIDIAAMRSRAHEAVAEALHGVDDVPGSPGAHLGAERAERPNAEGKRLGKESESAAPQFVEMQRRQGLEGRSGNHARVVAREPSAPELAVGKLGDALREVTLAGLH